MSLSTYGREALLRQNTEAVLITLVEVIHETGSFKFTSDAVATLSRGVTYVPKPFYASGMYYQKGQPAEAMFSVTNVDRSMVYEIRTQTTPMSVTVTVVTAQQPDTVELTYSGLQWRNPTVTGSTASGPLTMEHFLQEPFPGRRMTPARYPALFWQ